MPRPRLAGLVHWRARFFFKRDAAAVEKPPDRVNRCLHAGLAEPCLDLGQGDVWTLVDQPQQQSLMGVQLRTLRRPHPLWRDAARSQVPPHPFHRRTRADIEHPCRRSPRHPARNRPHNAFPKIGRIRPWHPPLPYQYVGGRIAPITGYGNPLHTPVDSSFLECALAGHRRCHRPYKPPNKTLHQTLPPKRGRIIAR